MNARAWAPMLAMMLGTPTMAAAQSFTFEGSRENVNPINTGGACVPPYFRTVTIAPGALSSTGTSNLGSFTSTQSHCVVSPLPSDLVNGQFTYTFRAGDTITGTYVGSVANGAVAGQFNATENLTITGGTGRFTGATGTITSNGLLRFEAGNSFFNGNLTGSILATQTVAGDFAVALGEPAAALGTYSVSIGSFSTATRERAIAIGSFAEATGVGAVSVGDTSIASGPSSSAFGQAAVASGELSTALGNLAQATNVRTTAVGRSALASGLNATAVGNVAQATGMGASAFGNGAVATQAGTVAVGVRATASAANGTALGALATASGVGSTALGRGSTAAFDGSTAVGSGATTTAANQVTLGGAGSSVRVGDIAASTAAQSGTVAVATVDASGTLGRNTTLLPAVASLQSASAAQAAQLSALEAAGNALSGRVDQLFDLRQLDRRDMRQGIAASVAMGHASMPSAAGRTSFVLNGATFRGEYALGGAIMHRIGDRNPLAIGAGFSFAGNKNNAVRLGLAGEF